MASTKEQLSELRRRIAEVDLQLLEVLEKRFRASQDVHRLVEEQGGFTDINEREVLETLERQSKGEVPPDSLRAIFSEVMAAARTVERPTRVAFVGPEGNFCNQMARSYFGAHAMLLESATVPEALEQVRRERATYGVFAFDSSVDGLILPAISALADTELMLVAERTVEAVLSLMSVGSVQPEVHTIYATATAHAMCELYLEREHPKTSVLDVRSPAEAAQLAREEPGAAAILPEATGRKAGLEVLRTNVGDEPELKYRFGVVGTRPTSRTGNDTTCLLFSLEDAPGTLYQVLSHFAERGINLKKIQSRPVRAATWDYVFYVEVSGHATDRPVVTALEAVKRSTRYLKLLGSFPTEG